MQSTTWVLQGVDTAGRDLVLSRLQAWGAGGALVPAAITSSFVPFGGTLPNLLDDDESLCCFSATQVEAPGFYIQLVFSTPVELWGFRFAGPSDRTWPFGHSVLVGGAVSALDYSPWLGPFVLSAAPTIPLNFTQTTGVWTKQGVSSDLNWSACDVSADARVQLLVSVGGYPMLSTDGGGTWIAQTIAGARSWYGCAVSNNGSVLLAAPYASTPWLSKDSGVTWVSQAAAGAGSWRNCAVSGNGQVLLALNFGGYLSLSKNMGATWAAQTSAGARSWRCCALSNDGSVLMAVSASGPVMLSVDGGTTWADQGAGVANWYGCAMSSDGQVLFAVAAGSIPVVSKDRGATWQPQAALGSRSWYGCAVSGDGTILLASDSGGYLWLSRDSGASWEMQSAAGVGAWQGCAIADSAGLMMSAISYAQPVAYAASDKIYQKAPARILRARSSVVCDLRPPLAQGVVLTNSVGTKKSADTEHGGRCTIYGTVELYAQTGNIPLPRRVRLHRSRDGLLVRETWSDTQGRYRFDGITDRYSYDVIAWDHEGLQRSVVANDLTPEVMP